MGNDVRIKRVESRASRQHGVVARRQTLECGLSDKVVARLVRTGRWNVGEPGVYIVAGSPRTFRQRVMVAALGESPAAAVSHLAAGFLQGLVTTEPARIDVTVPSDQRDGRRYGKVVHRALSLGRSDVRRVDGIRVTRPERTLVDLAASLDRQQLEHAVDTAINRGLVTIATVERYIEDRRLQRLKGVGTLRSPLADRKDGVPGSGLERAFRRVLRERGLPAPKRQTVATPWRLDFAYPKYRLYIEVDGDAAHASAAALRRDLRRQNDLVLRGWGLPLRYTESCVYEEADRMCAEIDQALRARGWKPRSGRNKEHRPPETGRQCSL